MDEKLKKQLEDYKAKLLKDVADKVGEGTEAFATLKKELTEHLDAQIKEQAKRRTTLPGFDEENKKKTFNIHKALKASLNKGEWDKEAGYEKEVCEQLIENRSSNASSGAAGGYLIPDEVATEVIDLALARTAVRELGPTILTNLLGELPIPKITGRPTLHWVGEEEAPAESAVTFGEIKLAPKDASAFVKMSQKLLYQSAGTAEMVVRDQLTKAFAVGIETALINGTGSNGQPKGISQYSDFTPTDTLATAHSASGRFRVDDAQRMSKDIDVANMLDGNLGYLMRPEVQSGMMRERVVEYSGAAAGGGAPVINPFMTRGIIEQALYGSKVRTTTLVGINNTASAVATDSNVIFGDWSQLILAFWQGFEIKASDTAGNSTGSAFTQRQVWMIAHQGIDINVKDQTGFCMIPDADTNESNW